MPYAAKEIYYTLQGEGAQTGRAAVFLRFTGCNLWSGREEDRSTAICSFCDTDFIGIDGPNGGSFTDSHALAQAVMSHWPDGQPGQPLVVCTGGEPLLQLDQDAVDSMHQYGLEVAIETNGTRNVPPGVDWVCVSPKAGADLVVRKGNELKLVFPQAEMMPDQVANLDFQHFFLQPMDGPNLQTNVEATVDYCLRNPCWRLSLQTHKWIGIP